MNTSTHESACASACECTYQPRFDIVETDDELRLFGDFPGVASDQLNVEFENNELVITARVANRYEALELAHREFDLGDFRRVFRVGEAIDATKIEAELKDGVLTLLLPKTEAVKPRKIKVKAS